MLYGVGTVLVDRSRLAVLRELAATTLRERPGMDRTTVPLTQALHPIAVLDWLNDSGLHILAHGSRTPRSTYIERVIRQPLLTTRLLDGDDQFEWAFDRFQFAVGLLQTAARSAHTPDTPSPFPLPALAGNFGWRRGGRGHEGPYPDLTPWVDDPATVHQLLPDGDPTQALRQAHLAALNATTRNIW